VGYRVGVLVGYFVDEGTGVMVSNLGEGIGVNVG